MRQNTQDCVEEGFSCHSFCVAAGFNQLLVFRGYSRPPALPALQHNIVLRCHLQLKKQVLLISLAPPPTSIIPQPSPPSPSPHLPHPPPPVPPLNSTPSKSSVFLHPLTLSYSNFSVGKTNWVFNFSVEFWTLNLSLLWF